MSLLIRYAHIPFYFLFSFTFPTSPIHPYAPPLQRSHMHSLYWTDLAYLMDIWLTIHMYLLLLLVSLTCPLLRSNQSRGLTPCGQALSIASPYARILVYHSYLTSLYLLFAREHHRWTPNQLPIWVSPRIEISHSFCAISHYFASHHTATIPPSLLATTHLETIPYPQIAPPQSPIGFILRSPAT